MDYSYAIASIEKPTGKQQLIKKYQKVDDIIKDLIYCFKTYNYQAVPIAKKYRTGNFRTDAKNIYYFTRDNIDYDAEGEDRQTSRSFSQIMYDGWGDCKHTALVIGSLGWNEGYNVIFRVVEYAGLFSGDPITHIYVLLENPKTGEQIIVDPLQMFDYEKNYSKKIGDYKAIQNSDNMALYRLSGIPTAPTRSGYNSFVTNAKSSLTFTTNRVGSFPTMIVQKPVHPLSTNPIATQPKASSSIVLPKPGVNLHPPALPLSSILKPKATIIPIPTAVPALQIKPTIPSPATALVSTPSTTNTFGSPVFTTSSKPPAIAIPAANQITSKLVSPGVDGGTPASMNPNLTSSGIPTPLKVLGGVALAWGLFKLLK